MYSWNPDVRDNKSRSSNSEISSSIWNTISIASDECKNSTGSVGKKNLMIKKSPSERSKEDEVAHNSVRNDQVILYISFHFYYSLTKYIESDL